VYAVNIKCPTKPSFKHICLKTYALYKTFGQKYIFVVEQHKTRLFGWKAIDVSSIYACGKQSISSVSKMISDDRKHSSIPADVNNVLPTARVGSGGGENNANTRSFGKCLYNFNKGNSGVLTEGSWVGELSWN
jgi:hypothetical protein